MYCAENQWEQMCEYYADPNNFDYYCGIGYFISQEKEAIPEMDHDNGGTKEVVVIDVPNELGEYFMALMERYQVKAD